MALCPPLARGPVIRKGLESNGWSQTSIDTYQSALRTSTQEVYGRHWNEFTSFLEQNNSHPRKASLAVVVEFLNHLASARGLKASTIRSYVSAIRVPLRFARGLDLFESPDFPISMGGLDCKAPVDRPTPVAWNLQVVLNYLFKQEPLRTLQHIDILSKCLFLVAVSSGKRVSELAHFGWDPPYTKLHKTHVELIYLPGFIAKNERPSALHPTTRITALNVGPTSEERYLCPIRAIYHLQASISKLPN